MKVFEFKNYKEFVLAELGKRPKKGHGQFIKIAKALNIHTTMVTHILRGELHLSMEQGVALADFLGLNELETDYFLNLICLERAGDQPTKKYFESKLKTLSEKAQEIGTRLQLKNNLGEAEQAIFYSNWLYVAIRLLSAIPKYQSRSALSECLHIPSRKLNRALDFLIAHGLCQEKGNAITYGEVQTYVDQTSMLVSRHHINWRLKAMEYFDHLNATDFIFTNPIVVSEEDFLMIRKLLLNFIEDYKKIATPSPSEKLCCLNIDWLQIEK